MKMKIESLNLLSNDNFQSSSSSSSSTLFNFEISCFYSFFFNVMWNRHANKFFFFVFHFQQFSNWITSYFTLWCLFFIIIIAIIKCPKIIVENFSFFLFNSSLFYFWFPLLLLLLLLLEFTGNNQGKIFFFHSPITHHYHHHHSPLVSFFLSLFSFCLHFHSFIAMINK